jgi:hypothetical protein
MLFSEDVNLTIFGDLGGNATDLFLFPTGTDIDVGSDANQAATLLNLVLESGPGRNYDWNSSGIAAFERLVDCGIENACFVAPLAVNFMSCFILGRPAPCAEEWEVVTTELADVGDCLSFDGDFEDLSAQEKDGTVLCIMDALLPAGLLENTIKTIESIFEGLQDLKVVVVSVADILLNGLPGEVILFVFGWAEWDIDEGKLVAPYKWWYCIFAVSMFIAGIELIKVFATGLIVWTKR